MIPQLLPRILVTIKSIKVSFVPIIWRSGRGMNNKKAGGKSTEWDTDRRKAALPSVKRRIRRQGVRSGSEKVGERQEACVTAYSPIRVEGKLPTGVVATFSWRNSPQCLQLNDWVDIGAIGYQS